MTSCISYSISGEGRCSGSVNAGSNFCNFHYKEHHKNYIKYKKLDKKAASMFKSLDNIGSDIEGCLKIHKALMDSYKSRKKFRASAVHPTAYDEGHNMRINILWGWIEKCTSVLETMHLDSAQQYSEMHHNQEERLVVDPLIVRAMEDSQVKLASKKSKAIKKADAIREEEKIWSTFIPMAMLERRERHEKVMKKITILRQWINKARIEASDADVKWILLLSGFIKGRFNHILADVISDVGVFILISETFVCDINEINNYETYNSCPDCVSSVYHPYINIDDQRTLFISFVKNALIFKALIESKNTSSFTVKLARIRCDVARYFFKVNSKVISFDYYASIDDIRCGSLKFYTRGILCCPPPGGFDEECCKKYNDAVVKMSRPGVKYPVIFPVDFDFSSKK